MTNSGPRPSPPSNPNTTASPTPTLTSTTTPGELHSFFPATSGYRSRVQLDQPAAVIALEDLAGGLGGRIRGYPEDFMVEELPLFRPSGRGEHTIVQVEKRATPTLDVLLFLSKLVKISERRIGYAGLKDARAVARQYLSLPKIDPERVLGVQHRRFRVLSAARHDVGLKIGHLRGNRFTIRIRDCDLTQLSRARAVLERLVARGVPNAYGIQRFGTRQDGHVVGRFVLQEDWQGFVDQLLGRPNPLEKNPAIVEARAAYDAGRLQGAVELFPRKHRAEKRALGMLARGGTPKAAFEAIPPAQRRIWLSAWQSYMFNQVLDARVRDGTYDQLLPGDLAHLESCGAAYLVTDPDADAARAQRGEASATGPLIGYDMRFPEGTPGELEHGVMAANGTTPEQFLERASRARGARRPLRILLREASLTEEPDGTVLARFVLPSGAFATVILDHLMRSAEQTCGVPSVE